MVSVRLRGPAPTPATESRAVSSGNNPRSLHESREVAWRPGRAQCWGCRFWARNPVCLGVTLLLIPRPPPLQTSSPSGSAA